jgi:nucleotide-binding universal stress UspA family protein
VTGHQTPRVTVLAAYHPDKGGRATLNLAAQLASGLGVPLAVAVVTPEPWRPSAESAARTEEAAAFSARARLAEIAPGYDAEVHVRAGRSVSATLIDLAADVGAAVLVLGSSPDGHLGQVTVGSTAGRLLHSSPLSVALAPRGYRGAAQRVSRITCAAAGEDSEVVARARRFAGRLGVRLRIVTLAVRGGTVWGPDVSPDDEGWTEQARDSIERLRGTGLPAEVETVVGAGRGWREAVDSVDWEPGELLVVGSRPKGPVARVFLGARATKILRHSPVPVLVLPG